MKTKIAELEKMVTKQIKEQDSSTKAIMVNLKLCRFYLESAEDAKALSLAEQTADNIEKQHGFDKEEEIRKNLAEIFQKLNMPGQALEQYEQLAELQPNKNDISASVKLHILIAAEYWHLSNYKEADKHYHKSLNLNKDRSKKQTAAAISGLGLVKWKQGDFQEALSYYQKALAIYTELSDTAGIARMHNYSGIIYKRLGRLQDALAAYKEALSLQEKLSDSISMAKLLNNIGNLYLYENDHEQALDYYIRSLKLSENSGNKKATSSIMNNVGLIYFNLGQNEKALSYFLEALAIRKDLSSQSDLAHSFNNVGLAFMKLERQMEAVKNLEKSLSIEEKIGDKSGMACTLSLLGNCSQTSGDLEKAHQYLRRSLQIYEEIGDKSGIIVSLINDGSILSETGKFNKAKKKLHKALELAQEIKAEAMIRDSYQALSNLAKASNNFEEAYNYLIKYIEIKEKLSNEESTQKIHEMQAKYDLEKQEKEAEIYRLKNVELVEANMKLTLLKENLQKRVAATTAENRKKDSLLIAQSRQAAMGQMIGFIAHQWRQPLNSVSVIAQNILDSYIFDELDEEKLTRETDNIMQQIKFMSDTIDDFRNFFQPDKEKVDFDINEVVNKILSFVKKSFSNNNISLHINLAENCRAKGLPNEYAQVILNILNNARDAFKDGKANENRWVKVSSEKIEGKCLVTISDSAGGIKAKDLPHIFKPYFTTKEHDKGTGMGLYMSRTIIEEHMQGTITARNTKAGMEFKIII